MRYMMCIGGVYALVLLGVGPLTTFLLSTAMSSAGISTLTQGNITMIASQPVSFLLVFAAVTAIVIATFGTSATLFAIADLQLSHTPPSLVTVCNKVAAGMRTMFRIESLLLALVMCVVAPLAGFALFAPLTAGIAIPPFIVREFVKTDLGALGWNLAAVVLLYLYFRTTLTFPISVVTGKRPARSFLQSLSATNRGGGRLAVLLGAAYAATWLFSRLATELSGRIVDVLSSILPMELLDAVAGVSVSLLAIISTTLFAFILVAHARIAAGLPVASIPLEDRHRSARPPRAFPLRRVAVIGAVVGAGFVSTSGPALAANDAHAIVVAHRGYDTGGVENTISGLEAAAAFAPDYVEVDIQQTIDGGFVASHDINLLVLAGENRNIYEMTTEEVTATTVAMKGNSDKIPTMTAYVQRAKELGVPLMIELKMNGHEQHGFVPDLLNELDSIDALHQNIYHSLSKSVVAQMKTLHPKLRVGLILGMAYGEPPNLECDFYTIEQASYTAQFLHEAHANDREVYVWTVNGERDMRRFLRDGADGLVTDRPAVAEQYRDQIWSGGGYIPGDALDKLLREDVWR